MTRPLGKLLFGFVLSTTWVLLACGDDDGGIPQTPEGGPDAMSTYDAGVNDAAFGETPDEAFYADPSAADSQGLRADESPAVCVGSMLDDSGASMGCEVPICVQTAQTCCTGRADCCGAELPVADTAFDCPTGICLEGATLFGSPAPEVQGAAFVPRGDSDYDSGAMLPRVYDLRVDRVALDVTFGAPTRTLACMEGRCIESAAVGLVANIPQGARSHVRPLAALVWTAGEVLLMSDDRVVERWESDGGDWSLVSTPDGSVEVTNAEGTTRFEALIPPSATAQIVLYGHNINPGAGDLNARIESLSVSRSACETTRQWSERQAVRTFAASAGQDLSGVGSPSTTRDGLGELRAVYLRGDQLFATKRADDNFPARWVTADEAYPAFDGPIAGPDLSFEDGGLVLYFEQAGRVFRAVESSGSARLMFESPVEIAGFQGGSVHAPSVAARASDGARAMVVRESSNASGARDQILAYRFDGNSVRYYSQLPTSQLGDQVGDPEIFIRNGLHQVYVPYLRGTRWRIAHLVSEDLLNWNVADDSALIREGDEERMGPRAPDVSQVAETATRPAGIEMFYERFDGVTRQIGRAFRRTPESATVAGR